MENENFQPICSSNKAVIREALKIISVAFSENKNLCWMARKPTLRYIKAICRYCLFTALVRNGAYINKEKNTVVLVYPLNTAIGLKRRIKLFWLNVILIVRGLKLSRLVNIMGIIRRTNSLRPKNPYLYCVALTTKPVNRSTANLLSAKKFLLSHARDLKLTLYVQTSTKKFSRLFVKSGLFVIHGHIFNPVGNYDLWLIKQKKDEY